MPFKENLMSALHDAVGHRNAGVDDNGAVAKAASDYGFNQQQTRRLVETYNTAKTVHFFKSAEDRTGEFPLADPDVVLGQMVEVDTTPKKTATAEIGLYDYTDYDRKETDWLDGHLKAAESLHTPEGELTPDLHIDDLVNSLQKKAAEVRRTATHCRDTAGICMEKYSRAVERLTNFVQREHGSGNPIAYSEVLGGLDAALGKEAAAPIVRDLENWLHPIYRTGSESVRWSTFDQDHPAQHATIKEASEALFGYAEMVASAEQFEKMANDFETEYDELIFGEVKAANHDWTDEFIPEGALKQAQGVFNVSDLLPPEGTELKKAPAGGASGSDVGQALVDAVNKGVSGAVGASVADALKPSSGPAGEQVKLQEKLRNLQRQQILEDLITNDEILAGEDPQKVVNAYQAIMNTAPHVSLNKEVVRSVLRQATQSMAVSPFDAKAWAELENEILKQTRTPSRGEDRK